MPAALKKVSRTEVAVRVSVGEPTLSNWGEGRSPLGRNGQRHRGRRRGMGQAPKERHAETTSGRASIQQGLVTTCKDPLDETGVEEVEG